jgi:GMP synthase-like glutamine amidotransferase
VSGPSVVVLQHLAVETPGRLGEHLAEAGAALHVVELDEGEPPPDPAPFDAMVVMGGPMDVWEEAEHPWLAAEKEAIRRFVGTGRPFLGVCLGHQLLADALGGEVGPMAAPEVGVLEVRLAPAARADALLGDLADPLTVLQWHGSSVLRPPAGATVLAASPACPVQALRVGECAWGLQFHVEADRAAVGGWLAAERYRASLAATGAGTPESLLSDLSSHAGVLGEAADRVGAAFASAVLAAHRRRSAASEGASG